MTSILSGASLTEIATAKRSAARQANSQASSARTARRELEISLAKRREQTDQDYHQLVAALKVEHAADLAARDADLVARDADMRNMRAELQAHAEARHKAEMALERTQAAHDKATLALTREAERYTELKGRYETTANDHANTVKARDEAHSRARDLEKQATEAVQQLERDRAAAQAREQERARIDKERAPMSIKPTSIETPKVDTPTKRPPYRVQITRRDGGDNIQEFRMFAETEGD